MNPEFLVSGEVPERTNLWAEGSAGCSGLLKLRDLGARMAENREHGGCITMQAHESKEDTEKHLTYGSETVKRGARAAGG